MKTMKRILSLATENPDASIEASARKPRHH